MPFGADQAAVDRVTAQLAGVGRLGVAYSGGVDSATLLALAVRALGPARVLAVIGVSPSLADDERAAAHAVARLSASRWSRSSPGRASWRPTAPTARTAASTARTSCSPASTTRCARSTGSTRSPTARTPTTCGGRTARARARPPGTACCAAGRRRAGQGRGAAHRGGARAALRGQAGRAVPGLAHPAPRAGHPGEAGAGRGGRARRCASWVSATAGSATTATSRGSSCRSATSPGPSRDRCASRSTRRAGGRVPVRRGRPRRDPVRCVHTPAGSGGRRG